MMTAAELIQRAQALGASLWTEGKQLQMDAPVDFPDDLIELLRKHKPAVMEALAGDVQTPPADSLATLLAWASQLAEQDEVLSEPVTYVEAPLRPVSTKRVSDCAARQKMLAQKLAPENARFPAPPGGLRTTCFHLFYFNIKQPSFSRLREKNPDRKDPG